MINMNDYSINKTEQVIVVNINTGFLEWASDNALVLLDISSEKVVEYTFEQLFSKSLLSLEASRKNGLFSYQYLKKTSGESLYVKLYTSLIDDGDKPKYYIIIHQTSEIDGIIANSLLTDEEALARLVFQVDQKHFTAALVYSDETAGEYCDDVSMGQSVSGVIGLSAYESKSFIIDLLEYKEIQERRILKNSKGEMVTFFLKYNLFQSGENKYISMCIKDDLKEAKTLSHRAMDSFVDRLEFEAGYIAMVELKNYNSMLKMYELEVVNELSKVIYTEVNIKCHNCRIFEHKNIWLVCIYDTVEDVVFELSSLLNEIRKKLNSQFRKIYCDFKVGLSTWSTNKYTAVYEAKFCLNQSYGMDKEVVQYIEPSNQSFLDFIIKRDLPFAFERNEFEVMFQGIYDLKSGKLYGFEVLVRWKHGKNGHISPNDFIPLAEASDLITKIDLWVVRRALEEFDQLQIANKEQLKLNFNVSPRDFFNPTFVDSFLAMIMDSEVKAENVILELTETLNLSPKRSSLEQIKKAGIKIALDDFGSGFASFSQLKKYEIDFLKIDLTFIQAINIDRDNTLIVKAILSMSKNLGIHVIAEGIENEEQSNFLIENSCRFVQGFKYHKPMAIKELKQFFKAEEASKIVEEQRRIIGDPQKYISDYAFGDIIHQEIDLNGCIMVPSDRFSQLLECRLSQGDLITKYIEDKLKERFKSHIEEAFKRKGSANFSTNLLGKSGKINVKVIICYNEKHCYDLFFEDLSLRDEKYKQVHNIYNGYDTLFNHIPIGLIVTDRNSLIIEWNLIAEHIFGYSKEEALNNNVFKLLKPNDTKSIIKELEDCLSNKSKMVRINKNVTKQGLEIFCEWQNRALFDEYGKHIGYISAVKDVTYRERLESELKILSTVTTQNPTPIFVTDIDGIIEYVNDATIELTNYKRMELIGQRPSLLSSGQHTLEFYREMWTTVIQGDVWEGEVINKKKSGDIYVSTSRIFPIKNQDNKIIRFACVQKDITYKLEQENLVLELNSTLENQERTSLIGQMAAGIMHEINNPLSYIDINIHALKEMIEDVKDQLTDEDVVEEIHDILKDLKEGVDGIKKIAAGLKRFSYKSQSSELELIDLNEEIKTILIVAKNEYKYYAEVTFDKGKINLVKGDSGKLKQVLLNLIINAVHAIKEKGVNKLGVIHIETCMENNFVVCKISDTGNGIPEVAQARIFEAFFTTKKKGTGTGLGLSLSKRIIEDEHKGKISFVTEIGKGTTFTLILPVAEEEDYD